MGSFISIMIGRRSIIFVRLSGGVGSFTLIELLVVVTIISILVGILLPAVTYVKQSALKAACASNLRQIGMSIMMYRKDYNDKFPLARYMPEPFISTSSDPALPVTLADYISTDNKVYHCPGDGGYVYDVCGISYTYNNGLAGRTIDDNFFTKKLEYPPTEVPVSYDCDGYRFELRGDRYITVPMFHTFRNLLFADNHVGNYQG